MVGGMGRVFSATRADGEFTQVVALKVLRWEFAGPETVERFRVERQLLATLDHPGIARLIDGGVTEDGLPFLAMERVSGTSIDAYCADNALPPRRAYRVRRSRSQGTCPERALSFVTCTNCGLRWPCTSKDALPKHSESGKVLSRACVRVGN